jgi:hypothetical protein
MSLVSLREFVFCVCGFLKVVDGRGGSVDKYTHAREVSLRWIKQNAVSFWSRVFFIFTSPSGRGRGPRSGKVRDVPENVVIKLSLILTFSRREKGLSAFYLNQLISCILDSLL